MNSILRALPSCAFRLVMVSGALVALAQDPPVSVRTFARHDPARKVYFTIALEENGAVGVVNWSMKGEARYALLPSWDGARGVDPGLDLPPGKKGKLGLQAAATSEDLLAMRGGFLGLKKDERLQFYRKESTDQGTGLLDKDRYSWRNSTRDGVSTGTEYATEREDVADTAEASLVRTETGAQLRFNWWMTTGGELGASARIFGFSDDEAARILTFNLTNDDLRHWDRIQKTNRGQVLDKDEPAVAANVTARLTTSTVPQEESEVTVEIVGYEDWIPAGNLTEWEMPGNSVLVNAKAHRKDQPGQSLDRQVTFTFSLEEVSMEPGVCMNWPPKAGSNYGLRILEGRNPALEVLGPDSARTRKAGQNASLTVSTFSYGAWARLKVDAETEDGVKLAVLFRGQEVETIPLPYYERNDHIPLAWLKQHDMRGKPADWDGEREPMGNGFDGDGLTLYEEYRGFAVKGKHITGHPTKKDVFVHDETGQVEAGMALFEQITGLVVHRVDLEELGTGRVVNRNHGQGPHAVDQHGILLEKGPKGSGYQVEGKDTDMGSPPRAWPFVSIPSSKAVNSQRNALVAHEMSHCVGVQHHGDEMSVARWYWALQGEAWVLLEKYFDDEACTVPKARAPAVIQAFFEADGRQLTREDPWLQTHGDPSTAGSALGTRMLVYSQGSPFSGKESCVMRYVEAVNYAFSPSLGSNKRYIVDPGQTPKEGGAELCDTQEGTGVNSPGHKPMSRAGNATRGDCQSQLVVNDRYAK